MDGGGKGVRKAQPEEKSDRKRGKEERKEKSKNDNKASTICIRRGPRSDKIYSCG